MVMVVMVVMVNAESQGCAGCFDTEDEANSVSADGEDGPWSRFRCEVKLIFTARGDACHCQTSHSYKNFSFIA